MQRSELKFKFKGRLQIQIQSQIQKVKNLTLPENKESQYLAPYGVTIVNFQIIGEQ